MPPSRTRSDAEVVGKVLISTRHGCAERKLESTERWAVCHIDASQIQGPAGVVPGRKVKLGCMVGESELMFFQQSLKSFVSRSELLFCVGPAALSSEHFSEPPF